MEYRPLGRTGVWVSQMCLGAMMFGGTNEDRIILNESSVWSGSRQDADRADAAQALPEIRKLWADDLEKFKARRAKYLLY